MSCPANIFADGARCNRGMKEKEIYVYIYMHIYIYTVGWHGERKILLQKEILESPSFKADVAIGAANICRQ